MATAVTASGPPGKDPCSTQGLLSADGPYSGVLTKPPALKPHLQRDRAQRPRIDHRRLAKKHGPLPSASDQQTVLWYSSYRKNAENGAVEDAHGAYLRYREMTALAVTVMVVFLVASAVAHPAVRTILLGASVVAAEYLILLVAARNAAGHFVSNVLAIESAAE
jgi:hypothetical protein